MDSCGLDLFKCSAGILHQVGCRYCCSF